MDAAGTVEFMRYMNTIWDIMNTTEIKSNDKKPFKSAINTLNSGEIFEFLIRAKEYVMSLEIIEKKNNQVKRVRGAESSLYTGFQGVVINIVSFTAIYHELVEQHHMLLFLATYRFSQDHLEIFFGKIRKLNGCNDNPNPQQYRSAYKKLLFNASVDVSKNSNVSPQCQSNILTISSVHCGNKSTNNSAGKSTDSITEGNMFELEENPDTDEFETYFI